GRARAHPGQPRWSRARRRGADRATRDARRRGCGAAGLAPAERAGHGSARGRGVATGVSQPHPRGKFRVAYLVLAVAVVVAGVLFLVMHDRPAQTAGTSVAAEETWGTFQPAGLTQDRIQQIALHVGSTYRTKGHHQLVAVSASIPPAYQNNLPITQYVLSFQNNGQTSYQAIQIDANNVLYEMRVLGPQCSIASGKASTDRFRLLRREALELALYTFH